MLISDHFKNESPVRNLQLTNRIISSDGSLWGWRFALTAKGAKPETNVVLDVPYDKDRKDYVLEPLESYVNAIHLPKSADAYKMGASAPTISVDQLCASLPEFIHAIYGRNTVQHVHSANPDFFANAIRNVTNAIYETEMDKTIPHLKILSIEAWENCIVVKLSAWQAIENGEMDVSSFQDAFDSCGFDNYRISALKARATGKISSLSVMLVFTAKSVIPSIEKTRKYIGVKRTQTLGASHIATKDGMQFSCSVSAAKHCPDISIPSVTPGTFRFKSYFKTTTLDYLPIDGCKNAFIEVVRTKGTTYVEKHAQALQGTVDYICQNIALVGEILTNIPQTGFDEVKGLGFNHYVATVKLGDVDEAWPFSPEITNETLKEEIDRIGNIQDLPNPPQFIKEVDSVATKLEVVNSLLFLSFDVRISDKKK